MFSRYGIPDQIITDNGPQFTAEEFKQFCIGSGINHALTAPYHPSTNGEAERFVQTFKTSMQKHNGALQKNLCQFLLHYRSTPHTTTGKTPAEIMFGRNIKTRMDLLHPQSKERKQEKPKSEVSFGKNASKLEVGDAVWMRNYRSSPRWIPGSITTKFGPRNYQVLANGKFHKRHIDQLRSHFLEMLEDTTHKYLDFPNEQSDQDGILSERTKDLQTD